MLLCLWNFPGKNTGVGCHFLLQGIFLTQRLSPGLAHCRRMLYRLSYQRSTSYQEQPLDGSKKQVPPSEASSHQFPDPWVRKIPEKEMATHQYSCLENPMERGAWRATAHGVSRVRHDRATKPPQAQMAKKQETLVRPLGREDPLDKGMEWPPPPGFSPGECHGQRLPVYGFAKSQTQWSD